MPDNDHAPPTDDEYEERISELEGHCARLKFRLSEQTKQTQETAEQINEKILDTLRHHGVCPQGREALGHPIEQIVGTVIAGLLAKATHYVDLT